MNRNGKVGGIGLVLVTLQMSIKSSNHLKKVESLVHSLRLKSQKEWIEYCKSGKKPHDIPSHAHVIYKDSWISFGDWLGTGIVAPQNRRYIPFEEARKYVHSFGLEGYEQWIQYCKSGKKPHDIPSSPHMVYRDSWKAWGDWLGYEFRSYETNHQEPKQKLTLR